MTSSGTLTRSYSASGWPLLADDAWRLLHDDRVGMPLVESSALALTLATALLGELAIATRVRVSGDRLYLTASSEPDDVLAHWVFDAIRAEAVPLPVRDWLEYLAGEAPGRVGERLERTGHVRGESEWWRFRRGPVWRPLNTSVAGWPQYRLAVNLKRDGVLDDFDSMLVGFCIATGRQRAVFADTPATVTGRLPQQLRELPPSLRGLLDVLDAMVSSVVMPRR